MKSTLLIVKVAITLCVVASCSGNRNSDKSGNAMEPKKKSNRLIHEKSPYLQQHAYNPVDWYPWGEEAFAKARTEDKPIFLSIGYSTCHWCHVMERESFEVDSVAALMNQYFVSIKVDREERPDVDKVYMSALQAMGENGGWPMSMFLTPGLKPFFGGTYFPPENRLGRIGFSELLKRIHALWQDQRVKVVESAEGVVNFLRQIPAASGDTTMPGDAALDTCYAQASKSFDERYGGFGNGTKFPRPSVFNFLFRYYERTGEKKALRMCEQTLRAMSNGGMYDHIGGGFHRYSVDEAWRVPHFEKMLYDQAQIVNSLVDAFLITRNSFYERVIRETLEYVLRDLTDAGGAFYSAEDADSPFPDNIHEKGEGAFYVWTKKEIDAALGDEAKVFNFYYGVEEAGNALNDPQQEFIGKNIFFAANSVEETASFAARTVQDVEKSLQRSRSILFDIRNKRPRPHRDDKIITAWNGLMISAFARASSALNEPRYLAAARRAADFILANLYELQTGTLLRRYRDGESKFEANLDDFAFLSHGLIDLYEASLEFKWLNVAMALTQHQNKIFWDEKDGGFYDTSGKDSSILVRMKERYDGAEPAGNSMAVMNLLRLGAMTDNRGWQEKAERSLRSFRDVLQKAPFTMPQMAGALDFSTEKIKQIVVAGDKDREDTRHILKEVYSRYLPNSILLFAGGDEDQRQMGEIVPFIKSIAMVGGKATAYVCEDFVCQLPTSDTTTVAALLKRKNKGISGKE